MTESYIDHSEKLNKIDDKSCKIKNVNWPYELTNN